ncbi:MAG TPA: ABC transporter permease [Planctomycetota bacterium]|nr:ABC transporter permease [Planctomycetota bacterium]
MGTYIFRRTLQTIPVLIGVALIAFLLSDLSGSPVRQMMGPHADPAIRKRIEEHLGLNKPLHERFLNHMNNLLHGDLGLSVVKEGKSVSEMIAESIVVTLRLTLGAIFLAATLGVAFGVFSAWRPNSWIDYSSSVFATIGISFPAFFLGMLLMLVFSVKLGWFPIGGYEPGSLKHLVLPCLTLGLLSTASVSRLTRNCMLETMSQEYIRSARAKGRGNWRVLLGHAFPNALIPVVTVIGNDFAGLLSGAVLTETVFNIPGIGSVIKDAIFQRDLPVVMGCCVVFALILVVANIVIDVLYAFLDPRIRHGE